MNKSAITNIIALFVSIFGYLMLNKTDIFFMIGLFSLSGSITNWLAIHMLFEKVPLLYGSGIIINKFEEFYVVILGIQRFLSSQALLTSSRIPIRFSLSTRRLSL